MDSESESESSLLSSFDHIYEEYRGLLRHNHHLQSQTHNHQLAITSLQQEKDRLAKLYAQTLNAVVDQVEHTTTKHQLNRINHQCLSMEQEHKRCVELIHQDYDLKIADFEARIRGLLVEKGSDEATMNQLRQDLEAHKAHIHHLASRMNQLQSTSQLQVEELNKRIASEQQDKEQLNNHIQRLDNQLSVCRSKHHHLTSEQTANQKRKLHHSHLQQPQHHHYS